MKRNILMPVLSGLVCLMLIATGVTGFSFYNELAKGNQVSEKIHELDIATSLIVSDLDTAKIYTPSAESLGIRMTRINGTLSELISLDSTFQELASSTKALEDVVVSYQKDALTFRKKSVELFSKLNELRNSANDFSLALINQKNAGGYIYELESSTNEFIASAYNEKLNPSQNSQETRLDGRKHLDNALKDISKSIQDGLIVGVQELRAPSSKFINTLKEIDLELQSVVQVSNDKEKTIKSNVNEYSRIMKSMGPAAKSEDKITILVVLSIATVILTGLLMVYSLKHKELKVEQVIDIEKRTATKALKENHILNSLIQRLLEFTNGKISTLTATSSQEEEIVEAINKMISRWRDVLSQVTSLTANLASAVEQSSSTTKTVEEIVNSQKSATDYVTDRLKEIHQSIAEIIDSANATKSNADDAAAEIDSATGNINNMVNRFVDLEDSFKIINGSNKGMLESVHELIGQTDMIEDIARNSKLITVNIAIIAEKYNDQSISNLAESMQDTNQSIVVNVERIKALLRKVEDSTGDSTSAVNESMRAVKDLSVVTANVQRSFDEIAQQNTKVRRSADNVGETGGVLQKHADEVKTSMTALERHAQNSLDATKQVAVAIGQVGEQAAQINNKLSAVY